jgi:nicotinic acid mononucleotide adenylyltransferase
LAIVGQDSFETFGKTGEEYKKILKNFDGIIVVPRGGETETFQSKIKTWGLKKISRILNQLPSPDIS